MDKQSRRFFIALPVEDKETVRSLDGVYKQLSSNESFLKVVPRENYHITMKFIGSVESGLVESLIDSFLLLNNCKKVNFTINGIGAFPSTDDPSIIWAGLKCEEKPLAEIFQSVELLASSFGIPAENRKFIPHLTLARVKKEKKVPLEFRNYIDREKNSFFTESVFRELVLFESILKNTGPEYKKIEVLNL